jgi:signal transduction histidine kinase
MLNAEQAMPDGGEIILQTSLCPDGVCLDVIDSGCGIEPDQQEKVFRPFHTTKANGSGLGLATTRKIINAHGGTISLVSEVGRGTKFTIKLPITHANAPGRSLVPEDRGQRTEDEQANKPQ